MSVVHRNIPKASTKIILAVPLTMVVYYYMFEMRQSLSTLYQAGNLMSPRIVPAILGITLIWPVCKPGHCDSAVRATIQQEYNNSDAAANRGDAAGAAERFGDPNLKNQANTTLGGLLKAVTSPNFRTKIVYFAQPAGNKQQAVVVVKQHFQGILLKTRSGSTAIIASNGQFREFWSVYNGQWRTMRSRLLSMNRTLNGHTVKSW